MYDYIILGHHNPDVDSVVSGVLLENYLTRQGKKACFMIPDLKIDEETISICMSFGLNPKKYQRKLPKEKNKYILVDHHERDVLGEVVGVIDHHPTIQTYSYPFYLNENVSSTACLLVKGNEDYYTKDEIQLAILATMVDTVSFHSMKTRDEDITWTNEMCKKYNFDFSKLYQAGLAITDISSPEVFLTHGLKNYNIGDHHIASSYVSLANIEEKESDIMLASSYIENYLKENNLERFIMIVHDMSKFCSTIFTYYPDRVSVEKVGHIVSRGREVIPRIEKVLLKR